MRISSGAPFNISLGGADRNLDDVGNDRPIFTGTTKAASLAPPGRSNRSIYPKHACLARYWQAGNLPRNAGQGPDSFFLI